MKVETLITHGSIVTAQGILENAEIGINSEKIVFVGRAGKDLKPKNIIDAGGNYILPGIIDIHTHFMESNPYHTEVATETPAAAAGGITTAFHFIIEARSIYDRIPYYIESTKKSATIDMGFHCLLMNQEHLNEIGKLRELGIKGYKFLLAYKGGELASQGITSIDLGFVYHGMEEIKKAGGLAQVHCENYELQKYLQQKYINKNDFYSYNLARPKLLEEMDAYTVLAMASDVGCPLYLVHVGSSVTLQLAGDFKARGNEVYVESTVHALTIDDKGTGLKEARLAVCPPGYQSKEGIDKLWQAAETGEVSCIGTDSGVLTLANKMKDGNVWTMPIGWQEMPTAIALMLSEGVNKGRITLSQLVALMSSNPARIFGVYPRKGELLPGSDADITIVDLNKKRVVKPEQYPSAGDFSPYEGWELKGWPVMTMVRGKVIMQDGKVFDAKGWGKPVNLS